jgi:hypothetical protein
VGVFQRFLRVKSAFAQPQNGGIQKVIQMPEVQKCIKKVFGLDYAAFMDSTSGPGGVFLMNGFLVIELCKVHDCGDHQIFMIANRKDSRSAGIITIGSTLAVHLGDYDGPLMLPQTLQDQLNSESFTKAFEHGSFVSRDIHYVR